MSKIILNNVGSLIDATTAAIAINTNNAVIQSAMDNTLSRDGTSPNTMQTPLDMNSNQIINLPVPATNNSPLRLQDLETFNGGGTITNMPAGGTTGQVLGKNSNTSYDIAWQTKVISVGLSAPADFTVTGSPVTSSGTLGLTYTATPTGTGVFVKQNSPTITGHPTVEGITSTGATGTGKLVFDAAPTITGHPTIEGVTSTGATGTGKLVYDTGPTISTPTFSGALTVTSNSGSALAVGPTGAANPVLTIDGSTPSSATGLRVVGSTSGGTVNVLTTDSGANNNLAFNAKGTGTIGLGTVSTGAVTITPPSTLTGAVTLGSTINKVTLTAPATAATLTIANNKTLAANNSLTLAGTDGTTQTFQATDTIVGRATTDTLTNKTISASGTGNSINLNPIANSIGANVVLNNTANYFDGPSVAQGTSGTWFASGTVTVADTGAAANILAKLWDGTTVIASGSVTTSGAGPNMTISLSGFLASPAGNLRISCRDTTAITGLILSNASGNAKDSTITAIRIA